jgi:hypothetical protein
MSDTDTATRLDIYQDGIVKPAAGNTGFFSIDTHFSTIA